MINELGKDERLTKLAVGQLLEYLRTGKELNELTKVKLQNICLAILENRRIYSKSEEGRKAEASFQSKKKSLFFLYLLSKAGVKRERIIDLVPSSDRNISRMVKIVEKRLEITEPSKNQHWYQLGDGYLLHFYDLLVQEKTLKEEELRSIENFLEKACKWTSVANFDNNLEMIKREDLRLINPSEREDFLKGLESRRNYHLEKKKKTNKTDK
jgi:hypothetical protein